MYRILILMTVVVIECQQLAKPTKEAQAEASIAEDASGPKKLSAKHLPNAVQLHPQVISGGLPEGEDAFQELQQLGVEIVISVDGAQPDVATADKYGLRYIHLPHGYEGIPENRVLELAKAAHDTNATIYIHCHHGKHRSPAAASVACVAAGIIPPDDGHRVLRLAHTSPHYRGLFASVDKAKPIAASVLDELEVDFHQTVDVPPLAQAMVGIGHTCERLSIIASAGWRTPAKHPDLVPAHEALQLREHFTELLREAEVRAMPEEFRNLMSGSEADATKLETVLRQWRPFNTRLEPPKELDRTMERLNKSCNACHQAFRDVPLGEK